MTYPVVLTGVIARPFSLPVSSTGTLSPDRAADYLLAFPQPLPHGQEALWQTICR
ncbi:hypothetical protein ACB376_19260 [Klebsiella electrica]